MSRSRPEGMQGSVANLLILVLFVVYTLTACASTGRHHVLSLFFDGVPDPGAQVKAPPDKPPVVVPKGEAAPTAVSVKKPRPAIEQLKTWEEVVKALPKDLLNDGPDWVKAIREGVIQPRIRIDAEELPKPPFNFDTLVPAIASDATAPLDVDIEMVPEKAPFYKVVFPHSSHTLWLNCSSCHPGFAAQRGAGMQKIFAGEYCGMCHGKVAFAPVGNCARCHVNLVPADSEAQEAELAKEEEEREGGESPLPASPEVLEQGKTVYVRVCAPCHGEQGDGKGPLAPALNPKPRIFTEGLFKFRSTGSSSLPTDFDLFRTITRGIPGTAMPSFSGLPREDRFAVVHFIKTFSEIFSQEKPDEPIEIPDPPPLTAKLLETGKQTYQEAKCWECHGQEGRGDGPAAATLEDSWGDPIVPFDLTNGKPKAGSTLRDYYRDIVTGLQGTPMPDWSGIFGAEQTWSLVYYAFSLGEEGRNAPVGLKGDIFFKREFKERDETFPPARFPHWFHRIRVRCAVCHPAIFQMKAGANAVTMDAIRAGNFCGRCHPSYPDDKTLAWPASFEACGRCHDPR